MATTIPCRFTTPLRSSTPLLSSSSLSWSSPATGLLQQRGCRRSLTTTTTTTKGTSARPPPAHGRHLQYRRPSQPLSGPAAFFRTSDSNNNKPRSPRGRASYHSYDHPSSSSSTDPNASSSSSSFSPTERAILAAAYARVPEHGFSRAALALGARDAGYLDISTNLLPDGAFSLVRWHLVSRREALAGRARQLFDDEGGQDAGGERLGGVGRKVEVLTWERLMGNASVIRRWQEALAIMAQPSYVPASLQELAMLADEIWFLVGDTSVDPSWYTKRASLSTAYASTELFMTTDTSEGFAETRKFLRRRLAEVHDVGGALKSVGQWVGFTANAGLNVLRSKGMRI